MKFKKLKDKYDTYLVMYYSTNYVAMHLKDLLQLFFMKF
jgi:hypothetical protein